MFTVKHSVLLVICSLLVMYLMTNMVQATISPGDKKQGKALKVKTGPIDENVFDLNLITQEPSAKEILVNSGAYYKDTSVRHFNGTVLGFVTPWYSHGYDVSKIFAKKFDVISPVWFQITKDSGHYSIKGGHDIDAKWMKAVREKGKTGIKTIEFFPRFFFEQFDNEDFTKLLSFSEEKAMLAELLINTCRAHNFDGIVLEYWLQLGGRVDSKFLVQMALDISKSLDAAGLKVILVIPPFRPQFPDLFNNKHMDKLYKHVYKFCLMTYDFSSVQRPGANSPIYWIKKSIEHVAPSKGQSYIEKRSKILMGMNMYGNDYTPDGGGPIVGSKYLSLLKHLKKRLSYDEKDIENFFEVRTDSGRHYVFYPTLFSINERIKLAQELGVGISIWELGQGLDYFYDLF